TKVCRLSCALTTTQLRSSRSPARTPRKRLLNSTCARLAPAASRRNQPMKAIQRPPMPAPIKKRTTPVMMKRKATACPIRAAIRVARTPVAGQPPDNSTQDPAAIQRKSRNQIEDCEREVDVTEPHQQRQQRS